MEAEIQNFKWENHSWIVMNRLANLYEHDLLIDCEMYVEGERILAHKNILAAASPYFQRLFTEEPHKESYDFDYFKHKDVKAVIDFIYFGFVQLPKDDMKTFLEVAEIFEIQIACESPWVPYLEESQGEIDQMRNSEEKDIMVDDWNSLYEQEFSENDSLPEVPPHFNSNGRMGDKTGTDESKGCAETFNSSPYQQHTTNIRRASQLLPGNLAFSSVQEDRQNGRINGNLRALNSPSHCVVPNSARINKQNETESGKKQSKDPSTHNANPPRRSCRISQSLPKKNALSNPEDNQGKKGEKMPSKVDKVTKMTLKRDEKKQRALSSCSDRVANSPSRKKKKKKKEHVICKYCGEECLKGIYQSHLLAHRGRKDFTCKICEKTFELWASYKEHTSTCLYQCEICNKKITRRYSLQQHLLLHSGERPFGCSQCGKHYASKYQLNTHCHSHSEKRVAKTYTCEVCGKTFNVRSSYVKHMLIHTNERPYVCDTCGKGFNDKTTLRRHMFSHTGEKPFNCEQCDRSFSTKISLTRHMYCHMDDSAKPFKCTECEKSFTQYVHLQNHMYWHTGERPYRCKICGMYFFHGHHLTRHEKYVHKAK